MKKQTIIFIGSQGSGKGTQASLLEEFLKEADPTRPLFTFDTGPALKEMARGNYHVSSRMQESLQRGELQPTFLAAFAWSQAFLEHYSGEEHTILQGSPRSLLEAYVLNTALSYFDLAATIIFLNVSKDVARERLFERGRDDDTKEAIDLRLSWFDEKVLPVIDLYREDKVHQVIDINADKSVEEVQDDIRTALNL